MQEGGVYVRSLPGGSAGASTSTAQEPAISSKVVVSSVFQGTALLSRGASTSGGQAISLPSRAGMSISAFQIASNTPRAVASTSAFHGAANSSRHRFHIELKEGETNVVSWKKLLKEANKNGSPVTSEVPAGANPALEARLGPERAGFGQASIAGIQQPLPPPANRFSSVIEKIERLYKGVDSEDEDAYASPDDSQYDSKDGFIDDTELDDYFAVDKVKTKHTGFFVHRGKLEKVRESPPPSPLPVELTRKRRRNVTKVSDEVVAEESAKRRVKPSMRLKEAARKTSVPIMTAAAEAGPSTVLGSSEQASLPKPNRRVTPLLDERDKDAELMSSSSLEHLSKVNLGDAKHSEETKRDVGSKVDSSEEESDDAEVLRADAKQVGSLDVAVPQKQALKRTESTDLSDDDRIFPSKSAKTYFEEKLVKDGQKESKLSAALPKVKKNQQVTKDEDSRDTEGSGKLLAAYSTLSPGPKEASPKKYAGWPKGTVLERAITDLEKGVAEVFPLAGDRQAAIEKAESGGKSKRLPREVKQKLAKVARLAAKKGKIADDFIDRLMNIIGHVMRLKTLKRNLKAMVEMGLNAKQEKDVRLQDMKLEVTEIVKSRVSTCLADAEQREGSSQDMEGTPGSGERAAIAGRFKWDETTENRICDLYEHYVEGMDEHKGPQIRKLYIELAELWPDGWMDNHGIKSAVLRVKERRKKLNKLKMGEDKKRKKPVSVTDKHKADKDSVLRERHIQASSASSGLPIVHTAVPTVKEKLTIKSSKQRLDETSKQANRGSLITVEEARKLASEVAREASKRSFLERVRHGQENGSRISDMAKIKPIAKTQESVKLKRAEEASKVTGKLPKKGFEGKIVEHGPRKRARAESVENESLASMRNSKNSNLNSPLVKPKKKKPKPDGQLYTPLRITPSPKKVLSKTDRVVNGTHAAPSRPSGGLSAKDSEPQKETPCQLSKAS